MKKFGKSVKTGCLYHFDEPVSPHLAVQRAVAGGVKVPTDLEFQRAVKGFVGDFARETKGKRSSLYIESAGGKAENHFPLSILREIGKTNAFFLSIGVHSPTLNGTSQLEAFRPLLPPTLLVASHELGGISTTISAYESLLLRGYEIDAVLCFKEDYYENFKYFEKYFELERGIKVGVIDSAHGDNFSVFDNNN
ncbi:MAG: hypothetical protein O7C60_02990, partial [Rickettsia endosymbiont of Ixodes persulcatus]|nr:hypothetical protein [Rickettsia endosymbiont of Ixodes persulcatus]